MSKSASNKKHQPEEAGQPKVRIDKWLWAARFFKTRAASRNAIEGGKVHVNGQRAKPSRYAQIDDTLVLRQGFDEKTITIKVLSDVRKGAPEAQLLFEETTESIKKREEAAANRKALRGSHPISEHRPDKKQRRRIIRFQHQDFEG